MCLGIPGRIVEIIDADKHLAKVDIGGVKREIDFTCIIDEEHPPESCLNEWVLVHVGFAMARINEEEANRTLELLKELGEAQQQFEEMEASKVNS